MNDTQSQNPSIDERVNNLRATFEILAYLQVDARRDGHQELVDRLEFAMNCAEHKLSTLKKPVSQ